MSEVNPKVINQLFLEKIATPTGIAEFEAEATGYVRKKLRESSFARKILPPQYVTKAELHPSVNHDGVVKIVDIEPDSTAMALNFRDEGRYTYIEGERYEIPFYEVSSDNFQKTEQELLAYNMPITEVIERNSVFDIHKQEDKVFLSAINAAITQSGKSLTGTFDSDGSIKKKDLKALFDLLDGDELAASVILMEKTMFNRLFLYPATVVGDAVASDAFLNGMNTPQIAGRPIIVSNKKDLLGNNIYVFTSPEFLGEFDILEDIKFWLKKEKSLITFANYETVGMGIGNIKAAGKLTLSVS